MSRSLSSFSESFSDIVALYKREIVIGSLFVLGSASILGGYAWYHGHQNRAAHKAYSEVCELKKARVVTKRDEHASLFERVFTSNEEKWHAVAQEFGVVAQDYTSSPVGALAGIAQANAHLRLGERDTARALFKKYYSRISGSLEKLYGVTYGQLLLESADQNEQKEGRQLLEKIASNGSVVRSAALFALGEYYWTSRDFSQARNYWKQLLQFEQASRGSRLSWWGERAEKRLSLIEARPVISENAGL